MKCEICADNLVLSILIIVAKLVQHPLCWLVFLQCPRVLLNISVDVNGKLTITQPTMRATPLLVQSLLWYQAAWAGHSGKICIFIAYGGVGGCIWLHMAFCQAQLKPKLN